MKKIILLFVLLISVYISKAQSTRNGTENLSIKNPMMVSSLSGSEGFIDNITVYPNPVIDLLKVSFKSAHKGIAVISLFNNIGKQVYVQEAVVEPGNNILTIDIKSKSVEPGIYFFQCVAENEVFTRKLILK
jgi:hypothetical protein